jgi:SAM-dependent methyltransferase
MPHLASIYDYPKYYDLVYGSDWRAEYHFLEACFQRHARRPVRRVFEPACGTGRLLVKLAARGYQVAGNDLNRNAVDYCNRRLVRHGFPATAEVGDMADFRLTGRVDAAFNMINSFRHLTNERAAVGHLRCVYRALARGGLYVLGLHLTPTVGIPLERETWSARRGHLAVVTRIWSKQRNRRQRTERVGMTYDVHTPKRTVRIEDELVFRTYTWRQMDALLGRVAGFRIAASCDFAYDIDRPVEVGPETEDVVYVLVRA